MAQAPRMQVQTVRIHGHDRAYLKMGKGPALLLIHGIGSRHETWLPVIEELAKTHTVIAPDLLGHGQSAKPRADYSIGGYANGMRDLLTAKGYPLGDTLSLESSRSPSSVTASVAALPCSSRISSLSEPNGSCSWVPVDSAQKSIP